MPLRRKSHPDQLDVDVHLQKSQFKTDSVVLVVKEADCLFLFHDSKLTTIAVHAPPSLAGLSASPYRGGREQNLTYRGLLVDDEGD